MRKEAKVMSLDPEDVLYYSKRVTEEREAARRSRHPAAAAAHEALASRYVAILEGAYRLSVRTQQGGATSS
jgi:hypothetical protein